MESRHLLSRTFMQGNARKWLQIWHFLAPTFGAKGGFTLAARIVMRYACLSR
jgi:hypothetical protein